MVFIKDGGLYRKNINTVTVHHSILLNLDTWGNGVELHAYTMFEMVCSDCGEWPRDIFVVLTNSGLAIKTFIKQILDKYVNKLLQLLFTCSIVYH